MKREKYSKSTVFITSQNWKDIKVMYFNEPPFKEEFVLQTVKNVKISSLVK